MFTGNLGEFIRNHDAVAGLLGQTLMICMVVIVMTSLAAFVFDHSIPSGTSHLKPECRVDTYKDTVYIKHTGGEPLATGNMEILVYINGSRYVYSHTNISEGLEGKKTWGLADVIEINVSKEWNRKLTVSDRIEVTMINYGEGEVLQGIRVVRGAKCPNILFRGRWRVSPFQRWARSQSVIPGT